MGKGFSRFLVLTAGLVVSAATAAAAGDLTTTTRGVKPQNGAVMIAVFDSADAFSAHRPFAGQRLVPTPGEVKAIFHGLPAGRYLVAAYQDADGDGKLSVNLFGVPVEAYGFGGDPPSRFGPPQFDAAAVTVGEAPVDVIATLSP